MSRNGQERLKSEGQMFKPVKTFCFIPGSIIKKLSSQDAEEREKAIKDSDKLLEKKKGQFSSTELDKAKIRPNLIYLTHSVLISQPATSRYTEKLSVKY